MCKTKSPTQREQLEEKRTGNTASPHTKTPVLGVCHAFPQAALEQKKSAKREGKRSNTVSQHQSAGLSPEPYAPCKKRKRKKKNGENATTVPVTQPTGWCLNFENTTNSLLFSRAHLPRACTALNLGNTPHSFPNYGYFHNSSASDTIQTAIVVPVWEIVLIAWPIMDIWQQKRENITFCITFRCSLRSKVPQYIAIRYKGVIIIC